MQRGKEEGKEPKENNENQKKKDQNSDGELNLENQIIIEEKQSKPNGEVNIVQYIRGSFLGKVYPPF